MTTQVVTLSVDVYDEVGACVGSQMAVRALELLAPARYLLDLLLRATGVAWRQMTYDECVAHFSQRASSSADPWEQLSIF